METTARVQQVARDVLGYPELRPGQLEAAAALADGRDCLAILPSGAGKSAIYQIAAPAQAAARAVELAQHHRSVERSRVEMMRRFAEMTDCRRRFLLQYFGEAVSQACQNCDNCDAGRSRPVVEAGLFSPGERVTHPQWGPGLVLESEADRLTVLFDDYGYRELSTQVVSGRHLLDPA